jgi:hypothetical protein
MAPRLDRPRHWYMSPILNPSLEDFLARARQAFGFLIEDFAFQEQAVPRDGDANDYQVRYVNTTTSVSVEGISWGYGVNVLLGPKRQPIFRRLSPLPLWAIVKLRRPDLYDRLAIGDQLEQLSAHAIALRECATEVLRGDFKVRTDAERLLAEQVSTGRSELEEWRYSQALKDADDAFRSKDYGKVVSLLAPHEKRMSPAQRLKLEYAKKHRRSQV